MNMKNSEEIKEKSHAVKIIKMIVCVVIGLLLLIYSIGFIFGYIMQNRYDSIVEQYQKEGIILKDTEHFNDITPSPDSEQELFQKLCLEHTRSTTLKSDTPFAALDTAFELFEQFLQIDSFVFNPTYAHRTQSFYNPNLIHLVHRYIEKHAYINAPLTLAEKVNICEKFLQVYKNAKTPPSFAYYLSIQGYEFNILYQTILENDSQIVTLETLMQTQKLCENKAQELLWVYLTMNQTLVNDLYHDINRELNIENAIYKIFCMDIVSMPFFSSISKNYVCGFIYMNLASTYELSRKYTEHIAQQLKENPNTLTPSKAFTTESNLFHGILLIEFNEECIETTLNLRHQLKMLIAKRCAELKYQETINFSDARLREFLSPELIQKIETDATFIPQVNTYYQNECHRLQKEKNQ